MQDETVEATDRTHMEPLNQVSIEQEFDKLGDDRQDEMIKEEVLIEPTGKSDMLPSPSFGQWRQMSELHLLQNDTSRNVLPKVQTNVTVSEQHANKFEQRLMKDISNKGLLNYSSGANLDGDDPIEKFEQILEAAHQFKSSINNKMSEKEK